MALLTSVPVASRFEVILFADGPAQTASVPENVAVSGHVLEDGSVGGPLHAEAGHELVLAVAVGVGGAEDVDGGTKDFIGAG